jgi:hypothetical protein
VTDRERHTLYVGGAIASAVILYLLLKQAEAAAVPAAATNAQAQPASPNTTLNFTSTPLSPTINGFPAPGTLPTPAPINVSVSGTGLGIVAPYFPLFGFVGIDSTQLYQ